MQNHITSVRVKGSQKMSLTPQVKVKQSLPNETNKHAFIYLMHWTKYIPSTKIKVQPPDNIALALQLRSTFLDSMSHKLATPHTCFSR